ncbi:MAG: hypothetical protein QM737_00040 [Ferruginibacter sp.]
MKKKLPFEEALENKLQHLPTPGEEASWQAMSQLLDKNKKRRPLFWRRRYFLFMLMGLLLLSGLWALLRNNETHNDKNENAATTITQNSKENPVAAIDKKTEDDHSSAENKTTLTETNGPESQVRSKGSGTSITKQAEQQPGNKSDIAVKSPNSINDVSNDGKIKPGIKDDKSVDDNGSTSVINKNKVKPVTAFSNKKNEQNKNDIAVKSPNSINDVSNDGKIETGIKDDKSIDDNGSTSVINKNKVKPVTTFSNKKNVQQGNDNNDIVNSKGKKRSFSKGRKNINIQASVAADDEPLSKTVTGEKDIPVDISQKNKKQVHDKARVNIKSDGSADDVTQTATTVTETQQQTKKDVDAVNSINNPTTDVTVNDTVAANVKPAITPTTLEDSTGSSSKNKTEPIVKTSKKHQKKSNSFIWSAGIGMQQQIPVGNQKYSAYGFNGKNNIINDYVPAAYLRLERKGKWFTQLEFSYASPRMVGEFPYNRKTTVNNRYTQISTTTTSLKKTYYHEIPLSFNYYIIPRWSVGAGGIYGWLHRAISEQRVTVKNIQSQQEQTATSIIPASYTDSFLYRSQFSWLLQTNYQWRRLSFGIRYSMDAQPYIKYTTPAGEINERRNWSLEFLLRLRLWKHGR